MLAWWLWGCEAGGETALTSGTTGTSAPVSSSAPYATTTTTTTPTTSEPATTSTTVPSSPIPPGGKEYVRIPGEARVVALTFDAAYDPAPLDGILAALRAEGVPATFFLTGEFAEDFPDSVAAIVAAGHPIGSHSYSHPAFTQISAAQVRSQLSRTADLLQKSGAGDPSPLFRFPYGARDVETLALVGREGYVSVYWTIDTLDWKPERTPQEIHEVVLTKLTPGAIVLMHVGSPQTAAVLPSLIRDLRAEGYGFVELRSALGAGGGSVPFGNP